jgi:hypothetical protein
VFPAPPGRVAARIAWSETRFGAVVPIGGAGGFALGAWMLHQHGLSIREIARRSAMLFWLTSAVNVCALILAGLALATALFPGPRDPLLTLVPAAVGILVLVCFHALPTITRRTTQHRRVGAALRATARTVTDTEGATDTCTHRAPEHQGRPGRLLASRGSTRDSRDRSAASTT